MFFLETGGSLQGQMCVRLSNLDSNLLSFAIVSLVRMGLGTHLLYEWEDLKGEMGIGLPSWL